MRPSTPHMPRRRDYRAMPELDQYDERDLDERDYAPISFAARQAAEASIREREKSRTAKADRVPAALLADDEDGARVCCLQERAWTFPRGCTVLRAHVLHRRWR